MIKSAPVGSLTKWGQVVIDFLQKYATICHDPDWPRTFVLPGDKFNELAFDAGDHLIKEMNGIPYIRAYAYNIRPDENIIERELANIWKILEEKETELATNPGK